MKKNEIVLFESKDGSVALPVSVESDTVWLTQAQMAQLFCKDRTVIGRHIRNAISEGEIDPNIMCAKYAHMGKEGDQVYNVVTSALQRGFSFIFSSEINSSSARMEQSASPITR